MYIDTLVDFLNEEGFHSIQVNVREVYLFGKQIYDEFYILNIFEYTLGDNLDKSKYNSIIEHIKTSTETAGFNKVFMLTIVFSNRIDEIKRITGDDDRCWLYDTSKSQLIVYENQPTEYIGLRRFIEITDSSNREEVSKQTNPYVMNQYTIVTTILILINVIVFICLEIIGDTQNVSFLVNHGALVVLQAKVNEVYRIFTSMFIHSGIEHIFGNMLLLFATGCYLERIMGRFKYILLYIMSGVLANIATIWYYMLQNKIYVSVGASAAVFGLVGALLYIALMNNGRIEGLKWYNILLLIGITLYSQFSDTNINNLAHVVGLISGFLMSFLLYSTKKITPLG